MTVRLRNQIREKEEGMSADNYMHIIKRDGKYVVQDRSASSYYADEGYNSENPPMDHPGGSFDGIPHPEWIEPAPSKGGREFDTLAEAEDYAHAEYSEYGVSYGFPVRRRTEELS